MRAWAWATAGLGLVVIVLTYVNGALLGVWADEHETVSRSLPGSGLELVVAGIGLVLLAGGVVAALSGPRGARGR